MIESRDQKHMITWARTWYMCTNIL